SPRQTREEPPRIGTQRPAAIAALLDDQRRQPEPTDQPTVVLEILRPQRPASRGVTLGGIEAQGQHYKPRSEPPNARQRPLQNLDETRAVNPLGQRVVDVVPFSRTFPLLFLESREIR